MLEDKDVVERLCWKIKSWSCADDWVVQACKKMARAHYDEHLRSIRVRMWWDKWKRVSSRCLLVEFRMLRY